MASERLDKLLVELGLVATREKAQALIMAGRVLLDGQPATKAGQQVKQGQVPTLLEPEHPFVGRGGMKLAHALAQFALDPRDKVCLDVGASTGGFTDCLLQAGAARVYAVDVGHGLIDAKLRNDSRVVLIEGVNARYLDASQVPEQVALAVVDVSFISSTKILPALAPLLAPTADVVVLVKPQFEVGRGETKKGIVRDAAKWEQSIATVADAAQALGLVRRGLTPSPIEGRKGNREFLLWLSRDDMLRAVEVQPTGR